MKVAFKTLGCRLNQHETDALVSSFDKEGYEIVPFKEQADVTVINTCTVTSQSDHKSRNIIQQAINANPGSKIVVTGCMAEQYKKDLEKIPGVSLVVNNQQKSNITSILANQDKPKLGDLQNAVFNYQPVKKSLHTRAAIKIQDGCDNFCTFCIIPSVRGRAVSRSKEDILSSIQKTLDNGFKEIVITGVNIGRYEHKGVNFTQLIKSVLELPGDFRVRISSLEPDGLDDEFISLFKHPKLTPHLHLCIQSGSDQVLLRMRRMYTLTQYTQMVEKIWANYPNFNLTTDIIVGFPGETEENFQQSLNIVKQFGYSHVHTFKYSIRESTAAQRMPNQVDEKIKNTRSEQLRKLVEANKTDYYKTFVGKTQRVLVEKQLDDGWYTGYGEHYVPITFKYHQNLKNEFIDIKINELREDTKIVLVGSPVNKTVTLVK